MARVLVVRVAPEESYMVLNAHHAITDGWSQEIVLSELWQAYGSLSRGEAVQLGEVRLQYADYSLWQRQW
eukprot:1417282-Ditylum_brightwellii.AAC.1